MKFGFKGTYNRKTTKPVLSLLPSTGAGMPTVPAVVCLQKQFPALFQGRWTCFHGDGTSHSFDGSLNFTAVGTPTTQTLPAYNGLYASPVTRQRMEASQIYKTPVVPSPTGAFSAGALYIPSSALTQSVICQDDASSNRVFSLGPDSGPHYYLDLWDTTGTVHQFSGGSPISGAENVVIATYSAPNAAIYVDGVAVATSSSAPSSLKSASNPISIGGRSDTGGASGSAFRCAFYTEYCLTATDVQNIQQFLFPMPQGTRGEQLTFARNSLSSMTAPDGTLIWLPPNRPAVGASGYKVTNLLQWSEAFDNAVWASDGTPAITADATLAPNGTMTADRMEIASHRYQSLTANGGGYALSVYVKSATPGLSAKGSVKILDHTTSTIIGSSTYLVGDSWQRITATVSSTTNGNTLFPIIYVDTDSTTAAYLWGAQLVTGSTPQDYIKSTATNGSYTVSTGAGLKMRPAITNLCLWSEDLSNAAWSVSASSATITVNTDTAPDGSKTADKLTIPQDSVNLQLIRQGIGGLTTGTTYTFSCYLKGSTAKNIRIASDNQNAWNTGSGLKVALTSEWQRVSITWTQTGNTACYVMIGNMDYTTGSADSTCYGDVLMWGAQLETGTLASDYVRSEGTSTTSAAETCTVPMPGVRTNLLTWSEDFSNAAWTLSNATVTSNSTVAPNGTKTADTLTNSVAGGYIRQTITANGGGYTASIYIQGSGGGAVEIVDVASGTSLKYVEYTANSTSWTRCTATVSSTVSGHTIGAYFHPALYGQTGSLYVWGAQFEQSPCATDYIPTEASTGTVTALNPKVDSRNKLLWSDDFTNSAWIKVAGTVTANATTAPDGSSNADKWVPNASINANNAYAYQKIATTSGAYATSVYMKSAGLQYGVVEFNGDITIVDLNAGTVSTQPSGVGSSASVSSLGNGWYRISLISGNTSANPIVLVTGSPSNSLSVVCDGTSGIYVWGAQLEQNSVATEYRKTTSVIGNYQHREGSAGISITPTWTGTNPVGGTLYFLDRHGVDTAFFYLPSSSSLTTFNMLSGVLGQQVSGGFSAGSLRNFQASWSASANCYRLDNLTTGATSGCAGMTGTEVVDSPLNIGSNGGGGQPLGSAISDIILHTDPNGWIKNN